MEQIKSEGEKVAKNENIFRYYSKNEENLKKQIAELDVKIQETMKKQTDLYPADVKLVENQIDEEIEKLWYADSTKQFALYWKICKLRKGVEKYEKKFFYGSCSGVSITANTGKCNAGGWKIRTCEYERIV